MHLILHQCLTEEKRNEPGDTRYVVEKIAELRQMSFEGSRQANVYQC